MNEAAKYDEQPASGDQIVAAANGEEAAVEQAAEGFAQEATEDIAGRAAPEHEEGMTAEQTATEGKNVKSNQSALENYSGEIMTKDMDLVEVGN